MTRCVAKPLARGGKLFGMSLAKIVMSGAGLLSGCVIALSAAADEQVPAQGTADAAAPNPAPSSGDTSGYQLESITVTAQKRSETLDKVPLAMSAFDEKAMEKLGSGSVSDAISLVPNLQEGTGGLTIRGVGTTAITSTTPTVAIHYDGIYTDDDPRGLQSIENWDLERVEVLRGPQGTLYGRNATAGVVNLVTAKPSQNVEAFGDVSYSTGSEKRVRFVLNEPVGRTFGMRLAGSVVRGDGLQENTVAGESNGGADDQWFARLATRWQPLEPLTWDLQLEYLKDKSVASGFQADWYASKPDPQTAIVYSSGLPPDQVAPQGPGASTLGNFADRNQNDTPTSLMRSTLRYQLGEHWSANLIQGLRYSNSQNNFGGLPLVVVDRTLRGNNAAAIAHTFSNELDVNFDGQGVHAVGGLYHYRKRSIDNTVFHLWNVTGSADPSTPPQLSAAADQSNQKFGADHTTSQAAFGQVTFDVTPEMRLTGGLRYTQDKVDVGATRTTLCEFGGFSRPDQAPDPTCLFIQQFVPFFGVPVDAPSAERSWNRLNWKGTVDYDFTKDLLAYATISTGYKQGSITGVDSTGVHVVKPESNTNYELGLRSELLDSRANANLTAFWMNYTDLQVSSSDTVNGVPTVSLTNVGKARIRGVEAELSALVTRDDRVDSYLTYLDAKVASWPNAADTLRGSAFTFDASGYRLPGAPESTVRVAYTHDFRMGAWGKLSPTVSTYHSTHTYALYTDGPQDRNPAYWRSDAFVRYTTAGLGVSVEAFVNNLEDKRTKATAFPYLTESSNGNPGGGMQWAVYSPGRIFGLRVGVRY